jgi:hypothetical protein
MPASDLTTPARPVHPINGHLILATLFPDEEIWAPVPGFVGHEASSKARIRSYWRVILIPQNGSRSVLTDSPQSYRTPKASAQNGRPMISLFLDGKCHFQQIGHWMLRAFIAPWPGRGWECCHNDGDFLNNDLSNLRWDTVSSNRVDMVRHGVHARMKLCPEDIPDIRQRIAAGESAGFIASDYGIGRTAISSIKRGKSWSWIP